MSKANDLTGEPWLAESAKARRGCETRSPDVAVRSRCGKSIVKSSTSLTKQNGVKSCGCLRHQKSPELLI